MFKSYAYIDRDNTHTTFKLIDSEFTKEFAVRSTLVKSQSLRGIVDQIIYIYESKNKNVVKNVTLAYIWFANKYIIRNPDTAALHKMLVVDFQDLSLYNRYYMCISRHFRRANFASGK